MTSKTTAARAARTAAHLLGSLLAALAWAQPAHANFASDCSGCHDLVANPKYFNGADAANIITYANTNMGARFTGGATAASIAAEIQATMPAHNPANEAITFLTPKTFTLPRIFRSQAVGTPAGATTSVSTVTPPTKGSVRFPPVGNGANYLATYTPAACQTGNDSFSYRASGNGGNTSTRTATVVIGNPTLAPSVSGSTPATGQATVPYAGGNFDATCETAGLITYRISAGTLPPGLALNTSTGTITGTPTTVGVFTGIVVMASYNCAGCGAVPGGTSAPFTINIAAPGGGGALFANGVTGVPFSYTVPATNSPTGFSATGLPPGLAINTGSGVISGTPTASGTYSATITVTNAAGTTSVTLVIVIAVAAPTAAGTSAQVPFETATQITLPIVAEQYTVNITTPPSHGLVSVNAGSNVVVYTPAIGYVGPDTFGYTVTNAGGTSAEATVTINVTPNVPTATTALFTVQLNTATALNLAPLVTGSTGVSVSTQPAHGTTAVNGLVVTYTPRTDYFGSDSFRYIAHGATGQSSPVTINIEVAGRPDPAKDRDVVGLVDAQTQAARRFAGVQVGNIHRRMEALHRTEPVAADGATPVGSAPSTQAAYAGAASNEPVRLASAAGAPGGPVRDVGPPSLVAALAQSVTGRNVGLNGASGQAGTGTTLWISGNAWFGNLDANGERTGSRFNTDGVTLGADRRFGERWAAGLAAGFAREDTKVGGDGTQSRARAASIAGYGSFQAGPRTYIDALLGYGGLDFDSDRHVVALGEIASASRKGRQFFGSIAASYEYRYGNLLVSPYGRIDFSADRLDAVTESGVGSYALRFDEQEQRNSQGVIGLRAESKHETEFGFAEPRARIEYRRDLSGASGVNLWYADLPGQVYSITPSGISRNSLLLGVGADLSLRGGLKVGLDYQAQRASGASNTQGVRLMVTQELDSLASTSWRFEPLLYAYPINVDFGLAYDDNVSRSREVANRLEDSIFSLSANVSRTWPLASNLRLQVTGLASGEKFYRYNGLGRFSGGAQAELQYRTSGAFDATTFALSGRALYEQYESYYRTGPRYFVGVNARRALTDRIDLFGEIGSNWRRGHSAVFDWRDYAAKINIDYALGRKGILYVSGEYRRGDSVSSGPPSLAVGAADVFVPDDAFEDLGYIAYRFDSTTLLGTVGVNYPLGARDSVDFSWRRIEGKARKQLAVDIGPLRYIDNQYLLMYLMRF